MDIAKTIAKIRFCYHINMFGVYNLANKLGILKDDKAEKFMKKHSIPCVDCLARMGYDVSKFKE